MITDFELQALVDGQLSNKQRSDLLDEIRRSAELRARFEELQQLKQLIRQAYRDDAPSPPAKPKRTANRDRRRHAARPWADLAAGS
jgi:anti-sigma factor RsiW